MTRLSSGSRLGPYEIVAPLGAGGMGEVYRARDPRLGRDVAIKVLPQDIAATPEMRSRFEREARTISQLNHPHICTLFDVGRHETTDYLVMELIEGETLARRLQQGPLPLADVLTLGRQIAEALDAAHRVRVVHRDLKPGNVMLTRGGAKLMDFGLARSVKSPAARPAGASAATTTSPTTAMPLTAEGTIVGTIEYMAPEQLSGMETDTRADVWALGCVLYEMTTGARAFAGDSQAGVIAAIMTGEPRSMTDLRPVAPRGLERLIARCLRKDPDQRLQSARDLAFALELVAGEDGRDAAGRGDVEAGSRSRRRVRWLQAAAALVIATLGFVAGRMTGPPSGEGAIRVSTLSQGTRDSEPAVSPDGRLIAFKAVRQNGQGLWLMDMVTRGELKLTREADGVPRFTPDGGTILFTRTVHGRLSLWRIPAIGGTPRLLLEDASDADVSPDGDRIAYVASTSDSAGVLGRLMIARSDGTGAREVWSEANAFVGAPRWSPDGARIAMIRTAAQNAPNALLLLDAATGASRVHPAPNGGLLSSAAWDGAGNGVLVAEGVGITALQRGAAGRLFRLDTRSGRFTPLGWLETFPSVLDLLPDGRLVLSSLRARQNLREVSMDARTLVDGRWLTGGMSIDRQPVYSPDGKSVMFSSNRGGALDLWEVSVETGEMHRVTDDPADDWDPEYGPDGQSIYWCSGRAGNFEIWAARRDGSAPRQVSRDSLDAENPSVSPDHRWLIYSSAHPAKSGIWRIPVAGGEGERLMPGGTLIPDLSPDGRHLSVITGVGTSESRLTVFDLSAGKALPRPVSLQVLTGTIQIGRSRFTPDGNAVVYIHASEDGHPVLLRRTLDAWRTGLGRPDTLFAGAGDAIESFGFSPDGKRATVSVVDWLSGLSITERLPGVVPPRRKR